MMYNGNISVSTAKYVTYGKVLRSTIIFFKVGGGGGGVTL